MKIVNALKAFGAKCNTSGVEPSGRSIAEVIENIADDFDITGEKGDPGADGKSVTAIALVTTGGAVTAGTVTFSDGTTAAITITTSEA